MNKNKKLALFFLCIPLLISLLCLILSILGLEQIASFFGFSILLVTPLTIGLSLFFLFREKTTILTIKRAIIKKFSDIKKYLKKVRKNWKEIIKKIVYDLGVLIAVIISLFVLYVDISLICGATIGPLLKKENKVSQFWDDKKIVGDVDLTLLKEEDRLLYWDADFFINGEWKPEGYLEINKEVNQPEYEANVGSVIKDSWPIGRNNTLYLECEEINESFLESPAWPICSLQVNNSFMINDSVRSEFVCDDNIGHTDSTGCKLIVGMVIYSDEALSNKYLFVNSVEISGLPIIVYAYELGQNDTTFLYFDNDGYIRSYFNSRDGMNALSLFFTSADKTDIRLITRYYEPFLESINIEGIYNEWYLENNRFSRDKKIVSVKRSSS